MFKCRSSEAIINTAKLQGRGRPTIHFSEQLCYGVEAHRWEGVSNDVPVHTPAPRLTGGHTTQPARDPTLLHVINYPHPHNRGTRADS